jgi:hypothetical protein
MIARSVKPKSGAGSKLRFVIAKFLQHSSNVNIQPSGGGTPAKLIGFDLKMISCTSPSALLAPPHTKLKPLQTGEMSVIETTFTGIELIVGWL